MRGAVRLLFVFQLLQLPIGLVSPLLVKAVVDDAIEHGRLDRLYLLSALLAGLVVLSVVLGLAASFCSVRYRVRVLHRLRLILYRHLQRLSVSFYDRKETGYLMSRQLDDVSNLGGVLPDTFAGAAVNVVRGLAFGVMLLVVEWRLAAGATLFSLLLFGFQYAIGGPLRRRNRNAAERWSEVSAMVHQGISGHLLVKSTAAERREAMRFARILRQSIRARLDTDLFGIWTSRLFQLLTGFVQPLIILGGIYLIVRSDLTIGDLFAFFLYLQNLVGAAAAVAAINPAMQASLASLERVFEVLDTPGEVIAAPGAREAGRLSGGLTVDGVHFAYPGGEEVLRGIGFEVPPRTVVALVGPSGAGKTTLARLIPRFYDPTAGRILVDGLDVRALDLRSYRRQIGIVPQEVFLFDRTIADNVAYGRPQASREEIGAAAAAANATEFIDALPDGFDTVVGERGVRLSGGQRQRIAIARELLRDPSILILDEATSALDSRSEALVQEALARLLADRTALVIAHRLSTVVRADLILVLDRGRIVERGRHEELIARGGLYSRLYRTQFRDRPAAVLAG
jgi:subfamily B ATP-binding cassette protein MsbA